MVILSWWNSNLFTKLLFISARVCFRCRIVNCFCIDGTSWLLSWQRSQTRETIGHLVASAQEAFEKDNVIAAEDMMAITIELEDKAPLKDSQHLRPSSESEEAKNPQRKVGRHSTSSDLDDSSSRKDVLGGQSVPSQLEKKASRSSVRRPSSTSEVDQKPFNRSARSRHLSPAQLTDKTVFKNLQKRRASRPPRSSFLSEWSNSGVQSMLLWSTKPSR